MTYTITKRLIIGGGGSAGHVLPSLRVAKYLKDEYSEIFYIGGKNSIEESICKEYNVKFFAIKTAKFDRTQKMKLPLAVFLNIYGVVQAYLIMQKIKPNAVFVSGGYASVPIVVAAKILGIRRIVMHVCDLSMGLSHKISIPFVTHITCTFLKTAETLKKGQFVGPIIAPVSNEESFKVITNQLKPNLLVYGGSLGASAINQKIRSSLKTILIRYNVIHICGKGNLDISLKDIDGYVQLEFVLNFQSIISQTDFAICRGGSNSLWELVYAGIPHIAVPLPLSVSRGDQIENCKYFSSEGVTKYIHQKQFMESNLIDELEKLVSSSTEIRKKMMKFMPEEDAQIVIKQILVY